MDPLVAAEEVGHKFLKSIGTLVMDKTEDLWLEILETIRRSPRGIIGTHNHKYNLLHAFADYRHDAAVEFLLSKGADVDAEDKEGKTILSKAIVRRDEDLSRRLVDAGASVRHKAADKTPLHIAAEVGSEKIVAMLLDRGADVNDTRDDGDGYTPLHVAAGNGHENVVTLLLERGADSTIKSKFKYTPLTLAQRNGFHSIVKRLLPKRKWIF